MAEFKSQSISVYLGSWIWIRVFVVNFGLKSHIYHPVKYIFKMKKKKKTDLILDLIIAQVRLNLAKFKFGRSCSG